MDQLHQLISSISVEQIALAVGTLTFLLHSVFAGTKRLNVLDDNQRHGLNLFIVRVTSVVMPIAVALATDPGISGMVHSYFPALLGFFTAYQGLYQLAKVLSDKWAQISTLTAPQKDSAPVDQVA